MIVHRGKKDVLGDRTCGQYARCFVSCQLPDLSVLESLIMISATSMIFVADMLSVMRSSQIKLNPVRQ